MDPISILALSGAAGFFLLKNTGSNPTQDARAPGLALHDALANGIEVNSLVVADGTLQLGGTAPVVVQPQPINAGAVLGTAAGIVTTTLGIITAVGGGSLTAGVSAIAGGVAAGAAVAAAVVAIIGFVVLSSFLVFNEVDALSKGRKFYLGNLYTLATAIENAVQPLLKGVSANDASDIAKCFAYAAVRGFNRSQIAFTLNTNRSDLNPVDNNLHLDYWADRARCLHEIGYIQAPVRIGPQGPSMDLFWNTAIDATVEGHIFGDNTTYAQTTQRLAALNLWHPATTAGNEEDCADFIGRAMGAMNIVQHNYGSGNGFLNFSGDMQLLSDPNGKAGTLVQYGVVGLKRGLPEEYAPGVRGQSTACQMLSLTQVPLVRNTSTGTVSDFDGKSGLHWFYIESTNTAKTVIR